MVTCRGLEAPRRRSKWTSNTYARGQQNFHLYFHTQNRNIHPLESKLSQVQSVLPEKYKEKHDAICRTRLVHAIRGMDPLVVRTFFIKYVGKGLDSNLFH